MAPIRVVIFDLDGVVRHFEPAAATEQRLGLPPGSIEAAALSTALLEGATTGRITFEEWIEAVGVELERQHGLSARAAAAAWADLPVWVDDDLVALAEQLRDAGTTTAILTNGTTRVESECATLGIPDHFDHLFNSARIGYAKPDRRVFEHVVGALGVEPHDCAFTDDSAAKLAGAVDLGMATHHYQGVEPLRAWLRNELGLTC
ncbi:MAG TPA: HAD-IA family hydrolase [Acidimicrobiia bacterium]